MKRKYSNRNILDLLEIDPTQERAGFQITGNIGIPPEPSHESLGVLEERENRRLRKQLGLKLKEARKASHYSQEIVSKTIGIPQSDVSKIEAGTKSADFFVILKMLSLYAVPIPNNLVSQSRYLDRAKWLVYYKARRRYKKKLGIEKAEREKNEQLAADTKIAEQLFKELDGATKGSPEAAAVKDKMLRLMFGQELDPTSET